MEESSLQQGKSVIREAIAIKILKPTVETLQEKIRHAIINARIDESEKVVLDNP